MHDRESVDEARAAEANIEAGRGRRQAKPILNQSRRVRQAVIGILRADDQQLHVLALEVGALREEIFGRGHTHVGSTLALSGDVALVDPELDLKKLAVPVKPLDQLVVTDGLLGQVRPNAANHAHASPGSARLSGGRVATLSVLNNTW